MGTVLLIIVVLLLIGVFPYGGTGWHGAGYWPGGIVGVLLVILIVWLLWRGGF